MSRTPWARRFRFVAPVLVMLAGACSPAAPEGPLYTGVSSRAYVGDAELMVRYRYEPQVGKEMVLWVDTIAKRGTVGKVRQELRLEGFTVLRGETRWEAEVQPDRTHTHEVIVRATDRVSSATVITHHIERDVQLATDDMRFWLDEEGMLSECEPSVEVCK